MNAVGIVFSVIGAGFIAMATVAVAKKPKSVYKNEPSQWNPMQGKKVKFVENENESENADGVRGHLESVGETEHRASFYERFVKRALDIILSFFGLVLLSPIFLWLTIWIKADDPGPVLFTQKRIGRDKQYFKLHNILSRVSLLAQREQSDFSLHGCPEMAA